MAWFICNATSFDEVIGLITKKAGCSSLVIVRFNPLLLLSAYILLGGFLATISSVGQLTVRFGVAINVPYSSISSTSAFPLTTPSLSSRRGILTMSPNISSMAASSSKVIVRVGV